MGLRVLIVEDEWLIALAACKQVESCGYRVAATARNGREALDLCRRDRPDVTLMDIRMPEMDGITATRRLMEESPHPIIIVIGNLGHGVEAEQAGVMTCVGKPLIANAIPRLVQTARVRFARFQLVRQESASCHEAFAAWQAVREATRTLMDRACLSEEGAFQQLREGAEQRQVPLASAAAAVLHT